MTTIKERVKEPVVSWIHIRIYQVSKRYKLIAIGEMRRSNTNYYYTCIVEVPIVDEPTVVLDCYDFPPAFKTHHLHDIFRSYESSRGGYKIKWLSDTRALIIFDHPATAKKAYIDNVTHALAKIRPYDGPTDFLKDMNQPAQQQRTMNRPMSMDFKRQSFNAYSGNNVPSAASRSSNRSSMRSRLSDEI